MIRNSLHPGTLPVEREAGQNKLPKSNLELEYPRSLYLLFLFFALYITVPIIEVPFLGLSLSAPVFFLIALPVLLRPARPWLGSYRGWISLAIFLWLSLFMTVALNGLSSGGIRFDSGSLVALVQFAYWFLVFVITIYLVSSQKKLPERLTNIIAIGIAILGLLRMGEAVFGGAIGAWTNLVIMSENGYAIQFSMFYPVLLALAFGGSRRNLTILASLVLIAAMLINGSRAGWLAGLTSTLLFLWMLLHTQGQRVRGAGILFILAGLVGVGVLLAPQAVVSAFEYRLNTFQYLDEEKSYAIRKLMVQKGLGLFESSPWTGVGLARWNKETVPLQIPQVLRYAGQDYFDRKSSHNSYVSYLAEVGMIGALPYAILLLVLAGKGYSAASRLAKRGQVWAIGVYAGFIGMSIHLWALSGLYSTATWFVYGLVAAVIALDQKQTAFDR